MCGWLIFHTHNIWQLGQFLLLIIHRLTPEIHYLFSWWQQTPELVPWLSCIHTLPSFQLHGNHTYTHCSSDQCVCVWLYFMHCAIGSTVVHAISRQASFNARICFDLPYTKYYIYLYCSSLSMSGSWNLGISYRSVPQIRPPFCKLSLSTKRRGGGGLCAGCDILSHDYAILPRLRYG